MRTRMLEGYRALDITDEKGFLCGKILAELGMDVIKVERPGGDPSRKVGPFWHDQEDPEKSLYWFAYNSSKRGITLDLYAEEGKRIFRDLVETADFVIESFAPGELDTLSCGYSELCRIRPDIILTSITPFGQKGPYSRYKAKDLNIMGMAGELFMTGESDRKPVNISLPQACLHAGSDAAVGSMIAHHHRRNTGEGQHVDISMQQSAAWFLAQTIPHWEIDGMILGRVGTFRTSSRGTLQRQVWPCRDGYIFFFMIGGLQGAKTGYQLVKWMQDEGMADDFLQTYKWEEFDMATATQELIDKISKPIAKFFLTRTKKEALDAAMMRNISICPLMGNRDLLQDPNLAARNFWMPIEHPELQTAIPYPRQFVRSSENETQTRSRAPRIGEHNAEVYGELGLTGERIEELKKEGVI
ncbi:MAG: CaiB/BaiF CoA-transferase family protein [Acidobacteriota bacterium]|jgi:crotonobetainyl-CoA:carnitine CoA-transferase CaiB-like acyl-CoA transferase